MSSFCSQCGKPYPEHDPSCLVLRLAQQALPPLAKKTPFSNATPKPANNEPHAAQPCTPVNKAAPHAFGPLNKFIWILAFAPLIGMVLEYAIAHIFYSSSYAANAAVGNGYFFWVTLLLNIGLCTLDEKHLRNHSINTQPIGAAWLVPVYIFKRSKHLQDGPVYFYLWIGTLVTAAIFSI